MPLKRASIISLIFMTILLSCSSAYSATLASCIRTNPSIMNENQQFTVIMGVTNTGLVDAPATTPDALYVQVPCAMISGPNPSDALIHAGSYQEFTWVYQTTAVTGTGIITGLARSMGDASADVCGGATITVYADPVLNQGISLFPAAVDVGQEITVIMNVSNSGGSGAEGVMPSSPLTRVGTVGVVLVSGPVPSSQYIAASGVQQFTWVYIPTTVGTLGFCGNVAGYAEYSKVTVTSAVTCSNTITVQTSASLVCGLNVAPALVSVGQLITLVMTVTNTGQADANDVCPSNPGVSDTGSAVLISSPLCQTITGGTAAYFTWTYSAAGAGVIIYTGSAQGTDANNGAAVSTAVCASNNVIIQYSASLICAIGARPAPANVGQMITVIMTVTNVGQASAINVSPSSFMIPGTGWAVFISGPAPPFANIAGGMAQNFTWTFSAAATGIISFSGNASGTDANSGLVVSTSCSSNSVAIIPMANLVISCIPLPDPVSVGQNITVIMNVSNTGSDTAINVQPSITAVGDASSLSMVSGPIPASGAIAPAGALQFTWVYNCVGPGTVSFYEEASGIDMGTGLTITAVPITCGPVTIQTPASLSAQIIAMPKNVSIGQMITVIMSITNTGQASALTVAPLPQSLSLLGTGAVTALSMPFLDIPIITGGGSGYFTWTFSAAGAGNICFSGLAQGYDANSGLPVSGNGTSDCVDISATAPTFTCTPTVTATSCVGEGTAAVNPSIAYAGSAGNTFTITYTAGATAWAGGAGAGTLKLAIPAGWSRPNNTNAADPGYITVSVNGGTISRVTISGQDIIINAKDLAPNTGQITVIYGDRSGGGPGISISSGGCPMGEVAFFDIESSPDSAMLCPISSDPMVGISCNTPTCTQTVSPTYTNTPFLPTPTNTAAPASTPCFVLKWGTSGTGDGQFNYPLGTAVDSSGAVYVADYNNSRIQKFDSSGNYVTQWGSFGNGNGQFENPAGVAVDSTGAVYVADKDNNRIQKFSSSGVYLTQWGTVGIGNSQFYNPWGIAVDSTGAVYVADTGNNRIEKFDSSGNYITQWGSYGTTGNGQFNGPCGIAVDSTGAVYVADVNNDRIEKFDSSGNYITKWGSPGNANGQFDWPGGVAVDNSGMVYVTEQNNNRVQEFDPSGNYITQWGGYGTGNGQFYLPVGIAIDGAGAIYVVDTGNTRVQKFGPCGTPTPTGTMAITATETQIETETPDYSATFTTIFSWTPTPTFTLAIVCCGTDTDTPTQTNSPCCLTFTYTGTPSVTWTPTQTATIVCCGTDTYTPTPTYTNPVCCYTPSFTPTMSATPTISPTATQNAGQLSIKKSVTGDSPAVGAKITYEIEITNNGPGQAFNITAWDTLPVEIKFVNSLTAIPYTQTGNYIVWDFSGNTLNAGASFFIDFEAEILTINKGVPIINYAGCDYSDATGKRAPVFSQLVFYPMDLPVVYPNPGAGPIKFTNIVPGSKIEIYTISGEFVNSMDAQGLIITWYCTNRAGSRVSPGVYYYLIRDSGRTARYRGKLFIINK
jgi:uncharacterized repeat protein (TIGR01451 family)